MIVELNPDEAREVMDWIIPLLEKHPGAYVSFLQMSGQLIVSATDGRRFVSVRMNHKGQNGGAFVVCGRDFLEVFPRESGFVDVIFDRGILAATIVHEKMIEVIDAEPVAEFPVLLRALIERKTRKLEGEDRFLFYERLLKRQSIIFSEFRELSGAEGDVFTLFEGDYEKCFLGAGRETWAEYLVNKSRVCSVQPYVFGERRALEIELLYPEEDDGVEVIVGIGDYADVCKAMGGLCLKARITGFVEKAVKWKECCDEEARCR